MTTPKIFLIGATGFVGSYLLETLTHTHPEFHILCLLRNATPSRIADLNFINPNIEVVEGDMEDRKIIADTAEKVDVVLHVAHSDHLPSVEGVLEGLERKVRKGGLKPIYLHMSGCGIIADNARGEKRAFGIKEWTDVGLSLDDCPAGNTHVDIDKKILDASTRSEYPIRSFLLFPGLIYGIGKSQRSGMWIPIFADLAKRAGHAGTWGPGEVTQYVVHVRDVVSAVITVLDAALEGKVKGGEDGLFFVTTKCAVMTWKDITAKLGDIMFSKGLIKEPGSKPFSEEITEPLGHYGWSLLGSNGHARAERLTSLGWKPVWSQKQSLQEVLPKMLEMGI